MSLHQDTENTVSSSLAREAQPRQVAAVANSPRDRRLWRSDAGVSGICLLSGRIDPEKFVDQAAIAPLRSAQNEARMAQEAAQAKFEQADLQNDSAVYAYNNAQETFQNWVATRTATQQPGQDAELIARTGALHELKAKQAQTQAAVEAQRKALLDASQALQRSGEQMAPLLAEAQERYQSALSASELRLPWLRTPGGFQEHGNGFLPPLRHRSVRPLLEVLHAQECFCAFLPCLWNASRRRDAADCRQAAAAADALSDRSSHVSAAVAGTKCARCGTFIRAESSARAPMITAEAAVLPGTGRAADLGNKDHCVIVAIASSCVEHSRAQSSWCVRALPRFGFHSRCHDDAGCGAALVRQFLA